MSHDGDTLCFKCARPIGEFAIGDPPMCIWCKFGYGRPKWDGSTFTSSITIPGGTTMSKDTLFEYAIIFHGKPTKEEADRNVRIRSRLLAGPKAILARDVDEVQLLAGREIPEEYLDRIDQVEVLVVPFA